MGRYSKAFSIKKQFQSPNCQSCQGQSRTLKKIVFLELLLRIIEEEKWNLFEKLGQLRTPSDGDTCVAGRILRGVRQNLLLQNLDRGENVQSQILSQWSKCWSLVDRNSCGYIFFIIVVCEADL